MRFGATNDFYLYVSNRPTALTDPTGLAQCLYEITNHTLSCVSTANAANQVIVDASSTSSGYGQCANNTACESRSFTGPIPPGKYQMNKDDRAGHSLWYRLEPVPSVPGWKCRLGIQRCGFALHLGHLSLGCINVNQNDSAAAGQYQRLLQMLDAEQGDNYLFAEN